MPQSTGASSALHVLTLTPFFPSDKNEVSGCYVAEPIDLFKEFGIDSSVIAVSPLHNSRKYPSATAAAEWVRYPQLPGNFGLSSAGKALYARLLERVRRRHKEKRIDVIHAHAALPCGHAAMLLSRRMKIPFVVTVHGLDVFNNCHLGGAPAAWRRKVSVEVYQAARTVICISRKVQEILKAGMPAEVSSTVVYNGVDPDLFSPPGKIEVEALNEELLVIGTLLPSKGHELVLRALSVLKPSFPKLRCCIIGEGPQEAEFKKLASELRLGSQVRFVRRQSRAEIAAAMQRCFVFVLPSRDEALGCVYLEAMSCGKPAIGCEGQGIEEVIRHGQNGCLIPPNGLEQLIQYLTELLNNPQLAARIGAAARQTILEKLTLRHQAENLLAMYRQVAS
jgi:teichuronic acid biosynthesis glycosyltransferase TuaC